MSGWASVDEATVRGGAAFVVAVLFLALEAAHPARARAFSRVRRWSVNAALALCAALLGRAIFPMAAAGAAVWADASGVGLFNAIAAPGWLAVVVSLLALDLALYLQHRGMHAVPLLWRLHAAHHMDPELDVSTGFRFHPLEALASLGWKAVVVIALGAPVVSVIVFEVALNAFAVFTHANLRLPGSVERALRPWLITPSIHRLHHDAARGRSGVNFGFSLALWDRVFGSWRTGPEPAALGLPGVRPQAGAAFWPAIASVLRPPV